MPVLTGADAAIYSLARLLSRKHARGNVDLVLADAGFQFGPGEKFTKLYTALTRLNNSGQTTELAILVDRLVEVHTLSSEDATAVQRFRVELGLGRMIPVDLGRYGGLRLGPDTRKMI